MAGSALTGHPKLRLYTRSCRLEMYVAERTWERLPMCACFTIQNSAACQRMS